MKGFVSLMLKAGYKGPWGIEVLSKDLRKLPLNEAATRAFNTTMAQFPNGADHIARHTMFGNDDRALTFPHLFDVVPSWAQDSAVPLLISRLGVRNRNSFMKQNDA